jgi:hypothetical protein
LLAIYRILFINQLKNRALCLIDLVIFLCVLTQPTNVLLLTLIYIDLLIRKTSKLLHKTDKLVDKRERSSWISVSLFAIGIGTIIYFLIILFSDFITKSYGTVYGDIGNEKYTPKFYLGKFWFNQMFALTYENLSDVSLLFVLATLVLLIFVLKEKIQIYCLYSLASVSAITLYWKPGLIRVMKYSDSLKNTVHTMPSNLIFIFMSFVILACVMRRFNSLSIGHFKLDNILLCSLLSLYLITGLHTISTAEFKPTISLRQGLCLANASYSQPENDLVKVPINPKGWTMLLPSKLAKCRLDK